MGVDARRFLGGLLRLDPAFAYVEPPSSWPLPWAECLTPAPNTPTPTHAVVLCWSKNHAPRAPLGSCSLILGGCCSVTVVFDSLWPHGLQHASLPCPSPSPRACSNSCPLSQWCHPTISSSVVPFSSCLQSSLASGTFPMSQFFTSGGQNIGASALASILPMNFQDWFPLGLTGLISLLSKGLSRVFYNTTVQKHQFFSAQPFLWSNFHIHTWLLEKP